MNVLKQCCFRSLRENRKRTVVTIIGIVLATALITAVACMAVSMRASMIANEKKVSGAYHYLFVDVKSEDLKYFRNNKNIEKFSLTGEIGYAMLEGSTNPDKPYVYIRAMDKGASDSLALHLVEGRMPQNDTELVIGRHIRSNGLVDIKIGDVLTLQVGSRVSDGYELTQQNSYTYEEEQLVPLTEKTYTVVGMIERPNYEVENRMAPGYSVFTYMEDVQEVRKLDVYATYTDWGLRHGEQVTAGIQMVADAVEPNAGLLRWELLRFSSDTMNMLYAMAALAIFIIIVTSVFCIRNSFMISLTEKMKLYGRLASVGTTSRQMKKIVYYEAGFLGLVGIPVGIACGVLAVLVLVKLVGGMVEEAVEIELVFAVSFSAILLAMVLAAVTIFFSASKSAKRASKVSPIIAIRANDTVKIGKRELKCPQMIGKLFGMGGVIAYKNLQRAKVKYRTTVVSIVVSVAVFLGMSTFVELISFASQINYKDMQYQMQVTIRDEDGYQKALQIAQLEEVGAVDIYRSAKVAVEAKQIPFTQGYLELVPSDEKERTVMVVSLGEEGYARYCKELGISPEKAEDKAIVLAEYELVSYNDGKYYHQSGKVAEYSPGDRIRGSQDGAGFEVEVLLQTDRKPMALSGHQFNTVVLIVSDQVMDCQELPGKSRYTEVFIQCEESEKVEEIVRNDMMLVSYSVSNYAAQYESEKSMNLVIAVFLYGFIGVVALIGITNIFNTITTNMELRAPEFAILKAVGMTEKEFRRMIWLEGMFYGGKSLFWGISMGLLISVGFYSALGQGIVTTFRIPWTGIGVVSLAVIVLLLGIMRYSMGKINGKNIIETIRNENI